MRRAIALGVIGLGFLLAWELGRAQPLLPTAPQITTPTARSGGTPSAYLPVVLHTSCVSSTPATFEPTAEPAPTATATTTPTETPPRGVRSTLIPPSWTPTPTVPSWTPTTTPTETPACRVPGPTAAPAR